MNRSQRSCMMPTASQMVPIGSQIDDLSVYKKMLLKQETMLAEQKRNIQ